LSIAATAQDKLAVKIAIPDTEAPNIEKEEEEEQGI
jgi:hypothetical protein